MSIAWHLFLDSKQNCSEHFGHHWRSQFHNQRYWFYSNSSWSWELTASTVLERQDMIYCHCSTSGRMNATTIIVSLSFVAHMSEIAVVRWLWCKATSKVFVIYKFIYLHRQFHYPLSVRNLNCMEQILLVGWAHDASHRLQDYIQVLHTYIKAAVADTTRTAVEPMWHTVWCLSLDNFLLQHFRYHKVH